MSAQPILRIPPLEAGDHLTAQEFMRRYEAMPDEVSAELIEGVVFMSSPVRAQYHGGPQAAVIGWLTYYQAKTPGTQAGVGSTLKLKVGANVPQPDAFLRLLPDFGGQSGTDRKGYITGAPEFVAEIAASSESSDLHEKLRVYERNSVQEYLVWRVLEESVDWFVLKGGRFKRLPGGREGYLKSKCFPGLWLDVESLIAGDLADVFRVLELGLATAEHQRFVERRLKSNTRRQE